jgi:prephenate dehydrogenase
LLQKDALVIDVCSVKEKPIQWMKKLLPQSISILGTHPMFGPDSAADGVKGKTIVLCPERISNEKLETIKRGLKQVGLNVITITPAKHDKQVAYTQALVHFLARSWNTMKFPQTKISTQSFERLNEISKTLMNDSEALFNDMFRYNRFAKEALNIWGTAISSIENKLKE